MATTMKPKTIHNQAKATNVVRDAAVETTKNMIAALEAGTVPWHKPWSASGGGAPTSLATNKAYRGANIFFLLVAAMEKGYTSQYWGTYRQIAERGGQVRKGERSTEIIFWKIIEKTERVEGKDRVRKIPLMRLFHVFNVDQCDWAADAKLPTVAVREPVEVIEGAEALVAEYIAHGPEVRYGNAQAFYRPPTDEVHMPNIEDFETVEHFYSTLYHELTHSTGHSKRLAREGIAQGTFGPFGSQTYSTEELVAEMGAAMLCSIAGINQAAILPASASYLAHWIKELKGDSSLLIKAASAAQKAVDLMVGTTFNDKEEEAA